MCNNWRCGIGDKMLAKIVFLAFTGVVIIWLMVKIGKRQKWDPPV